MASIGRSNRNLEQRTRDEIIFVIINFLDYHLSIARVEFIHKVQYNEKIKFLVSNSIGIFRNSDEMALSSDFDA